MAIRAVVFDIGGVLEIPTYTDLDGRWEQRLGLERGEFFEQLRRSGLGRDANLGRVSEAEFAQALSRLYGLDQAMTEELLADLWDWYVGELNTEMADYFQRLRPQYRTAIVSNASAGGRREEDRRYGFDEMADVLVYSSRSGSRSRIGGSTRSPASGWVSGRARWSSWTTWRSTWTPPGKSGCGRCCSGTRPKRSPRWMPA
jgi:FMN phosphatase YigB (HAD superfamily)